MVGLPQFRVWGFRFGVWGLGFLRLRVYWLRDVAGLGFRSYLMFGVGF